MSFKYVFAVDPGPEYCGVVIYETETKSVLQSSQRMPVQDVIDMMRSFDRGITVVGIERVQSLGISGASLLQTSESVGRLWQAAKDMGVVVELVYRRAVLKELDITGKGNRDALVRQRLLEIHPNGKGTKKSKGPLFGVAGHSWSALAVAIAGS